MTVLRRPTSGISVLRLTVPLVSALVTSAAAVFGIAGLLSALVVAAATGTGFAYTPPPSAWQR